VTLPERAITVVEVGPRDGLQNERSAVPTAIKAAFIEALVGAGLPVIEATSFVNPAAIPQLADAEDLMRILHRRPEVRYPVLVPNLRGFERAIAAGVDAIALFSAATDAFALKNVRASVDQTFDRFSEVVAAARADEQPVWIRGYVSVAFDCPYSGRVSPAAVIAVAERFLAIGCDEICLADTIGTAHPQDVTVLLAEARGTVPFDRLALHFHDTGGRAIENVAAALDRGITIFDAAAGGLGGCPFAPGAPGNLDTERLVSFLDEQGLATGVDPDAVRRAAEALRPALAVAS